MLFRSGKRTQEHSCNKWNARYAGKVAGGFNDEGYINICMRGILYRAHVIAWFYMTAEYPTTDIDHVDGDRKNNCFSNLRLASRSQNISNSKKSVNNTSGYKGVCFSKRDGKFVAQIKCNKKRYHLGYYNNPEEAHTAYCEAAKKFFGDYARFE